MLVCDSVCSAMEARPFRPDVPVTSFDDVMDLCVDEDVVKQPPPLGNSPRHQPGGVFPSSASDDGQAAFVTFPLDQDDSSGGSGVQTTANFGHDVSTASAPDLCLQLPSVPADAGSPSGSDTYGSSSGPRYGSAPRTSAGQCKVCGDEATGMYFGALVCVPCKVICALYLYPYANSGRQNST